MDLLFITHLLNALLMMAMPIALGIFLTKRFNLGWRLWGLGALTFILSQVGHIPFNALATLAFQKGILPSPPASWKPFFNPVFLGLSAGIWEEGMRYLILRKWAKDARSWHKGILFGAGHGGAEALILGGITFYAFLQLAAYRDADLSKIIPAAQLATAQQQVSAYWSAPWTATLLGALERLFTLPCQIALAVLVLQTFTRKQWFWLGLAVLWHAILDGVTVYALGVWGGNPWGIYAIEGVVGIFALLSLGIIFLLRQSEPVEPELIPEPQPLVKPVLVQQEIKPEDLDQTRYAG